MSARGTAFIFSYNADDEDVQAIAEALQREPSHLIATNPTSSRRAGLGSTSRRLYVDDDFIPYGPTTFRKGLVRFVPGGVLGGDHPDDAERIKREDKGKGRAVDDTGTKREEGEGEDEDEDRNRLPTRKLEVSGNQVKGLYASIVGLRTPSTSLPSTASSSGLPSPPTLKLPRLENDGSKSAREPDIVLSSDSEPEPTSEREDGDDEHDDIVILDPLTNLPELRTRPDLVAKPRLKPRLIPELLVDPSSEPLVVPPTYYALPETNFGYRLLAKQGWKEGTTLGRQGSGLKVPLRAVEKYDRRGLGLDTGKDKRGRWKLTAREKEDERRRAALEERDHRGKGSRGMAKKVRMDNAERKAWIAYMNR